jgi:hypothetical protein
MFSDRSAALYGGRWKKHDNDRNAEEVATKLDLKTVKHISVIIKCIGYK